MPVSRVVEAVDVVDDRNNGRSPREVVLMVAHLALDGREEALGRPTDFGYASSDAALAAGASWKFTTTIPSPIK